MKERDEMTALFRSRLAGAEMPVRDGFWEELQDTLALLPHEETVFSQLGKNSSPTGKKKWLYVPGFHRLVAAASVLLLLGVASAALWYYSPKEEIGEAFTQVAVLTPEASLQADRVQESFPAIRQTTSAAPTPGNLQPALVQPTALAEAGGEEEEQVSVHVSITISERYYANGRPAQSPYHPAGKAVDSGVEDKVSSTVAEPDNGALAAEPASLRHWAVKPYVGTSLPKGDYHAPLTAGVSVERRLSNRLSLEAGLQYNRLSGGETLHTLGIPVKMNILLADSPQWELYAQVGGMAEKCIAGAADNSFSAEPVQFSLQAGVGVRYRVSDRFALFAEPTISHHFDTDSNTPSVRTERATNMNLLCGVRLTY